VVNKKIILFVLLFGVLFNVSAVNKSRKTLESKRKLLEKDILLTKNLLKKTQFTKEASLSDLSTIEQQIKLRQNLILNTEKEVTHFNYQINSKLDSLKYLENTLKGLRKDYARSVYITYKYFRITDKFLFIASAKSFGESFRRLNYLRKLGTQRELQLNEIQKIKASIGKGMSDVNSKKNQKQVLLVSQKAQKEELNKSILEKNKTIISLKQREAELSTQLETKKSEAKKLDNEIQAIIQKEIQEQKLALEKKKKEAELKKKTSEPISTKNTTKNKKTNTKPIISETPENKGLSNNFAGNKGKLPWPVDKGFVSNGFGIYEHPELDNVIMENNGIDIRSIQGASVRSIYKGKVVSIISNPTFKNAVIISHGDYFSVYTKLESVNVEKGQTVDTKQIIGRAFTNDENETEIHLEIWKGETKLNPTLWIAKR
jgi:septal ring factor EnvC (AmiA/AmiB activator)